MGRHKVVQHNFTCRRCRKGFLTKKRSVRYCMECRIAVGVGMSAHQLIRKRGKLYDRWLENTRKGMLRFARGEVFIPSR